MIGPEISVADTTATAAVSTVEGLQELKLNRTTILPAIAAALVCAPAFAMPSGHKKDHMATEPAGAMDHTDHCGTPMSEGAIATLDVAKSKVKISHGAIASIGWPAMTMEFQVLKPVDLAAFGAGDNVHFLLVPQKDISYRIAAMCALDAEKAAHDACMKSMHEAAMKSAAASGKRCDLEMDDTHGMKMNDPSASSDHDKHH